MVPLIIYGKETNYLIDSDGYKSVKLTIEREKKDFLVHRLVASTFLENPNNLSQVNHKDKDKLNNSLNNLEWVSPSDNIIHSNKFSKKERQKIKEIDENILESKDWKQYKGTNYYFCKDGRGANLKTGKYLNASIVGDNGYYRYYLYLNNKSCSFLVHTIIYDLFGPEKLIKKGQINHKDGNKKNNHIDNLELISNSENMKHSYYNLKQNVKKVYQYDLNNNLICCYPSLSIAAKENNFSISGISLALSGKIKTYKNFYWKKY